MSVPSSGETHLQYRGCAPIKNGSDKEIRRLYDAVTEHYRTLKAAKAELFETLLTVILQQELDEKTVKVGGV